MSRIRINLSKTKIYVIGCSPFSLQDAISFLGYKVDKFPFKFIDFIVGGN